MGEEIKAVVKVRLKENEYVNTVYHRESVTMRCNNCDIDFSSVQAARLIENCLIQSSSLSGSLNMDSYNPAILCSRVLEIFISQSC